MKGGARCSPQPQAGGDPARFGPAAEIAADGRTLLRPATYSKLVLSRKTTAGGMPRLGSVAYTSSLLLAGFGQRLPNSRQ